MRRQPTAESVARIRRNRRIMRKACERLSVSFLPVLLLLSFLLALPALRPAHAQNANLLENLPGAENGVPLLVQADEMFYDFERDQITSIGNVEIYYERYSLLADKVIYDRNADRMTAYGNVKVTQPDGNVIFADEFTVTGDFREGFIKSLAVVTPEDVRVVAANAERVDGNIIVFNKAVYTACEAPDNYHGDNPIWQIKAARVTHNQEEQILEFEEATFEFLGLPVAYFPYFYHPDPSVKRKSGFLIPAVDYSEDLGISAELPYFWAIAPNIDATLTPRILSRQGFMMQAEYRHRLEHGTFTISGAGIHQEDPGQFAGTVGNRDWRGFLRTTGLFSLGENWKFGWDGTAVSDDTFLHVYDLDSRSALTSELYLTGLGERNYFDVRIMHFQDLAIPGSEQGLPLVHPVADYNVVFADPVLHGQLSMNFSFASLSRDVGVDSTHLIGEVEWKRTFTDRHGQQFTPFIEARGDLYHVNGVIDPITLLPRGNDTVTRGMAAVGVEYNYPWISVHEWGQQILEPVAQVIARPDEQNVTDISNEDAISLVFDDTVLFDTDKFSGFDRDEGGTRANVGLRYAVQTNDGGFGSVLVGQSFHLGGTNPFGANTGLMRDSSDIVGALYFEPHSSFGMSSQFRLDPSSYQINRHELNAWMRHSGANARITYLKARNQTTDVVANREEFSARASVPLTNDWVGFGSYRYDLELNQDISRSVGLGYVCDCFHASVEFQELFFQNQDITPDRRVIFRFFFRSLGGTSTSTEDFVSE